MTRTLEDAKNDIRVMIAQIRELSECYQNCEPLRRLIRPIAETLMDNLKANQEVFDYNVVCDDTNNPPAVEDDNDFKFLLAVKFTPGFNSDIFTIGYSEQELRTMGCNQ